MPSLYTNETLPTTSEAAIRTFDDRYLAGVSAAPPPTWATDLGVRVDLDAPRATFPMAFLSIKYLETREVSGRFKTLLDKSFDLKVAEYDAGLEAKLMDIFLNVFAYRRWSEGPARFLMAEEQHVLDNIATLLEDPAQTSPWDDLPFFSAVHKANPSGDPADVWSNFQATPADVLDISQIANEVTAMQGVRDENGKKMAVNPTIIMVPTAKASRLAFTLSQSMLVLPGGTAPVTNPYVGKFTVVHNPQLNDINDWYLIDPVLMKQLPAWLVARFLPPKDLGLRYFDESSDFFKNTGKIKVSSHIWYGFRLAFPQAIRRVTGV